MRIERLEAQLEAHRVAHDARDTSATSGADYGRESQLQQERITALEVCLG